MVPRRAGFKHGNSWQYHSRSDHHSKVACWGLLFDLMLNCGLLREHALRGLVGYGLNHEMRDFRTGRKKNLDLVVCRPRVDIGQGPPAPSFADQAQELGILLDSSAAAALATLPRLDELPVGAVRVALKAKACMTAFIKARPRLYDELNSSHAAIHGNSPHTHRSGPGDGERGERVHQPGKERLPIGRSVTGRHEPQPTRARRQRSSKS